MFGTRTQHAVCSMELHARGVGAHGDVRASDTSLGKAFGGPLVWSMLRGAY